MAGECDLSLIVVRSVIPENVKTMLEGMSWGGLVDLGGELRFFLGEKTVWRDMGSADLVPRQDEEIVAGSKKESLDHWEGEVDKSLDELMDVDEGHNTAELEALGEELWYGLLPQQLRNRLEQAADAAGPDSAPVLRIHTHLDWIPWEIMRMGTDYLGVRFQLARLPLLPELLPVESKERTIKSIYSLLGKGALEYRPKGKDDLTEMLVADWKTTFSFLAPHTEPALVVHKSFPSDEAPDDYPEPETLQTAIADGADILHITCTGRTRTIHGKKVPVWSLDEDRKPAELAEVRKKFVQRKEVKDPIREHRPLVFANACGKVDAASLLQDFGPCFIQLGAVAFVGAFANVSKPAAVRFAQEFYKRLLDGEGHNMSIGQALWDTKRHFLKGEEPDPSYLFYRLYGVPETRFEVDTGP